MLTIRELEIMKAALEGDINYQRDSHNRNKPEFKEWLADTEKLLKKVSRKLFDEKTKETIVEDKPFNFDDSGIGLALMANVLASKSAIKE